MTRAGIRSRVGLVVLLLIAFAVVSAPPAAAPKFSDWGVPDNLGATVNSAFAEQGPAISKDGLSLFFGSNRPPTGRLLRWLRHLGFPSRQHRR